MTVKEIESLTGLTRANIRFYEAEGLLTPRRKANHFREYSREDLETLQRIRLLRAVDMSLHEIKAVHRNEKTFAAALEEHLLLLRQRSADMERFCAVCALMRADGVEYRALDPQPYLDVLERHGDVPVTVPGDDAVPAMLSPARRYFARELDWMICRGLCMILFALTFHRNPLYPPGTAEVTLVSMLLWCAVQAAAASGVMLLIEPLLLSCLGTTAGKWILGFRVAAADGTRLPLREAFVRTWKLLLYGWGFGLPVISPVMLWKSYRAADYRASFPWERYTVITLKGEERFRTAAYVCTVAVWLLSVGLLLQLPARLPQHRGQLTVAEYSQNYNRFIDYHRLTGEHRLTANGSYDLQNCGDCRHPKVEYLTEDGALTGIRMIYHQTAGTMLPDPRSELLLAALSFGGAQQDYRWFSGGLTDPILSHSFRNGAEDEYTVGGLRLHLTTELSGYRYLDGDIFHGFAANDPSGGPTTGLTKPADGSYVRVTFTMIPEDMS